MQRNRLQQQSEEVDEQQQPRAELKNVDATDNNPLGLKDLSSPSPPKLSRWLGLFAFVLLFIGMLATLTVVMVAREKKVSLLQAEEKRLQESIAGRISILQTWLDAQYSASKRLTGSEVLRLFIADLALQDLGLPLPRSLQDQRPYFQKLLADFAVQNDLARAAIVREDDAILLSSPGALLSNTALLRQSEGSQTRRKMLISPIRRIENEAKEGQLVVDAVMPFPQAQAETEAAGKARAFLVLTLPIEPILEQALSSKIANAEGEDITLLQQRSDAVDHVRMTHAGIEIGTGILSESMLPGMSVTFGRHDDQTPVYLSGAPVKDTPWTLYHALQAKVALSPVHQFITVAGSLALIAVLTLTAIFAGLWWRQERNHHRHLIDFYRGHARRADQQRQFLQSVTTSISDWLTVSSANGKLIYANPAFEAAIGQPNSTLSGQRWNELVKESAVAKPIHYDLADLIESDPFDLIEVGGHQHVVSTSVSDMCVGGGLIEGTVRIVRDHTALVTERRKRLLSVTQTIDAFIHAVELRDPFLLGHTERVRTHAIAIGKRLTLPTNDIAGLALAASLSQVGKIFISDEILTKPDRHTPAEENTMRNHILHTVDILRRIDFELPIADILAQMHERLDGGGYPHGLVGAQISLSARILAVADVFCARTAPRSYRDRLTAGKTLYHLASNGQRYDLKVVAALAGIVSHDQEISGLETIEQTFIDTAIWRQKQQKNDQIRDPAYSG